MAQQAAGQFGLRGEFDISEIQRGAREVNNQLAGMERQARGTSLRLSNFFKQPASQLIFLGLDLQQAARSLAIFTAGFVLAGAAATKFTIQFRDQMRGVNALLKLNEDDFQALTQQILRLSQDPQVLQGPTELAAGLRFLASSGFEGAEAISILRAASVGATADVADFATVSRALVGILNAMPKGALTAQSAIDILFETVDKGIITFEELSSGIGEVLGAASAAEIPLTEVGAAIATMTRAGLPAEQTITSLNRVILSFIGPTTQATNQARELGIEFNLTSLRSKGLVRTLLDIEKAVGDDSDALEGLFGDVRAIRGVFALLRNGGQDLIELFESQQLATQGLGASAEALAEQLKKPGAQIKLLTKDLERIGIEIGTELLPGFVFLIRKARDLAEGFANLPTPVRIIVELFAGLLSVLTVVVTAFGLLITIIGAGKNVFDRVLGPILRASVAVQTTTAAVAANTAATQVNLTAQQALALRLQTLGMVYATTSGQITGATAATLANAAAQRNLTAATTASAAAAGGLLAVLLRLAGIGIVVVGIKFISDQLNNLAVGALAADKSTAELIKTLEDIRGVEKFARALETAFPPFQLIFDVDRVRSDLLNKVIEPTLAVELAIEQATQAQKEFNAEAAKELPVVRTRLVDLAKLAEDPKVRSDAKVALQKIVEEGAEALAKSGFSVLATAQKALLREHLAGLEEVARSADVVGEEKAREAALRIETILQGIGGLEIKVPVAVDLVMGPFLAELDALGDVAREAARVVSAELEQALSELEDQQLDTRLAQTKLNLALRGARREFQAAENAVRSLESQLDSARDSLQDFSQPVLVGMGALDNAIFAVSQRLAQLNLQILNIRAGFIPDMFSARREVLELRLALLEAGDEAENLGRRASFGIDDLISAQQRELREGVPVLRTIFEKIRAAAEGEGDGREISPERKALEDAQKRLEIIGIQQELATISLEQERELASVEQERLQLTKEITFAPQLRILEQMVKTVKEITFEEAVTGIQQAQTDIGILTGKLDETNAVLAGRKGIVDELTQAQDVLAETTLRQRIEELEIARDLKEITRGLNEELAVLAERREGLEKITQRRLFFGEEGDEEMGVFPEARRQAQRIEAETMSVAQQFAAGLGRVAEFMSGLIGPIVPGVTGLPFFHHGGEAGAGLPGGTPVPAMLEAGEVVLSRGTVAQLQGAGMFSQAGGSTSYTQNWNVNIDGRRGSDPYAKLYREARMRRLGGRW